jgi:hypothetical protein
VHPLAGAGKYPVHHLELGEAGESCALDIARGLGMPEKLLLAARAAAYPDGKPETDAGPYEPAEPEGLPEPEASAGPEIMIMPEEPEAAPAPEPTEPPQPAAPRYAPGDRVRVPFMNCFATVVLPPNARGEMLLRIRDKNVSIASKRVEPFLSGEALYPGEYDLDIVLDTWENRKKRKQIQKGHTGIAVDVRPGER